jgi:apolipoprotein N-acyltransferase
VLANISNIGWFGDTSALPQHLNISRMRSLELQRPMLRATNTGVTAIIDHQGRVTAQLPSLKQGVLDGTVEGRVGSTPYASWVARVGLWPMAAGALVLVTWLAQAVPAGRAVRP